MSRTTDDLLNAVKRTVTVPSNQVLLLDDDILALATEEMLSKIVPTMISLRQEYFLRVERTLMVTNQDEYAMPYRAVGRTLQDLKLFDGVQTRRMARLQTNDAHLFSYNAIPHSFYFRGDKVVVVPQPVSSNSLYLEQWFFMRPNKFTQTGNCGLITSVTGDVVTVATVPTAFAQNMKLDVVQGQQGSSLLAYDCPIASIGGNVITLNTGSLTVATPPQPVPVVVAGDWLAPAETSPVIQMPEEGFQMLVYRTTMRVLEAIGDFDGKRSIMELLPSLEKDFEMLLAPRIENEGQKVIQRNGLLRGSRTRYRRGLVY
jgi:hypothetical protein